MSHDEPLPQCEAFHDEMREGWKKHTDESVPVRMDVARHNDQILNLNKAHEATMADIAIIKEKVNGLDKKVDDRFNELKIWILTSAIAGLLVLLGECIWFGGKIHQVEVDSDRIHELELMHPRVGK